ncbi:MAG: hypothetical protein R3A52_06865 [Polyangiales bacterium]
MKAGIDAASRVAIAARRRPTRSSPRKGTGSTPSVRRPQSPRGTTSGQSVFS